MLDTDLRELYLQFNDDYFGGECPEDLPVEWNTRLRVTAGYCKYIWVSKEDRTIRPVKITLNPVLLDTEEKLENTLLHEMVRAWLAHTTNVDHGHNRHFQSKMNQIVGYRKSHTYHTYDVSKVAKVLMVCPEHGTVGRRARMPRKYNLNRYRCIKCYSTIQFVDKREPKSATDRRKKHDTAVKLFG